MTLLERNPPPAISLVVNAITASLFLDEIDSDENILGESWGPQLVNCSPNSDPLWELIGLIPDCRTSDSRDSSAVYRRPGKFGIPWRGLATNHVLLLHARDHTHTNIDIRPASGLNVQAISHPVLCQSSGLRPFVVCCYLVESIYGKLPRGQNSVNGTHVLSTKHSHSIDEKLTST